MPAGEGDYTSPFSSDCYDYNADANPLNTSYHVSDRGDGSYDYNCNRTEEVRSGRPHQIAVRSLMTWVARLPTVGRGHHQAAGPAVHGAQDATTSGTGSPPGCYWTTEETQNASLPLIVSSDVCG